MKFLPNIDNRYELAVVREPSLPNDPRCTRCGLAGGRKVCVGDRQVERSIGPVLLVVVDGVTQYGEIAAGEPFWKHFTDHVERLWKGKVVYVPAVRCPTAGKSHPSWFAACRPYLHDSLVRWPSVELVMCWGSVASAAVAGKNPGAMSRRAYSYVQVDSALVPVVYLPHPATVHDNRFLRGDMEADMKWAVTELPKPKVVSLVTHVVETVEEARDATALALDNFEDVEFDLETFGAFGDKDFRVVTVGLRIGAAAWVWDEAALGELKEAEEINPLLALLLGGEVPLTAHNAKFDLNGLWFGLGVDVRQPVKCSRLLRKIVEPGSPGDLESMQYLVGLGGGKDEGKAEAAAVAVDIGKAANPPKKALALEVRNMDGADFDTAVARVKQGRNPMAYAYAGIKPDVRQRYCGMDAYSCGELGRHFAKKLQADASLSVLWKEVVMPMQRAVVMMERNGVLVDMDAVGHLRAHLVQEIKQLELDMVKYGAFSPSSPNDVQRVLYDELKLRKGKPNKTGFGVDADHLESLKHPCADAIVAWRTATSWKTRYADGMASYVRDDGRVHPNILMDGTETGRPSCSDPNLFNLPRAKSVKGKMVRDTVVAAPRHLILEVDQSQVELRVAASLSGDPKMIALFESGIDFHLATAKLIGPRMGLSPAQVAALTKDSKERDDAKTVNFAVLYGGSTDPSLTEAIFGEFKLLKKYIDERLASARRRGHTRTHWRNVEARYRNLPSVAAPATDPGRSTAERSTWNSDIQGTAADITNAACGAVQLWLDDNPSVPAKLILTVYDSVVLEVREDALLEVTAEVVRICQSQPLEGVPLIAEPKAGPTWGTLKEFKH